MKYFELEYDNTCQKVLAVITELLPSIILTLTVIIVSLLLYKIKFPLGVIGIAIIVVSIIIGVALFIHKSNRLKGVFVFDDYIEIVSIDFFSRKIYFDDIYKINYIRKYNKFVRLAWPYTRTTIMEINAGGNKKCLEIVTDKFLVAHIKVKNQLELMRILYEKTGKSINVTDC